MKKTEPLRDTNIDSAYESSLKNALHQSKQGDISIQDSLEDDTIKIPNQIYMDEITRIKKSIQRDLIEAAHHMSETGKELKDWLGFDIALIKSELWLNFTEATDKTTLELLKLK